MRSFIDFCFAACNEKVKVFSCYCAPYLLFYGTFAFFELFLVLLCFIGITHR